MFQFEMLEKHDHEQMVLCSNKSAGLRGIIAIHDTTLGPAIGGARMRQYDSINDALHDALRVARTMTYKSAISGLNLGGGNAVIIGNPKEDKSEKLFRTFGKYVDSLGGRYITAEDIGTNVSDMEYVRMETKYVAGISKALGGSGDPSPVTAYGIYVGIKAMLKHLYGYDSLRGKKIAIQGAGNVARYLVEHLSHEGVEIIITDKHEEKLKSIIASVKAHVVKPDEIYSVDADIFAPCALGGIINDETIEKMKFNIIAGSANNQLLDEKKHGEVLKQKGILYAPDYVINAGGLINVSNELEGYRQDRALRQAEGIYETLLKVLALSEKEEIPTFAASNRLAEERLQMVRGLKNMYTGESTFSGRFGEITRKNR
jgi:leucine dehydrogenase